MGCISSPATTAVIALIREFRPSQQIATPCQGASTDSLNLGSIDALPHRLCRNTQETTDRDFDRCTPSRNDITLYLCPRLAHVSSPSSPFASFRSAVSKPSVNQP